MSTRVLYYDCDLPKPIWAVDPEYTTTAVIAFVIQTLFYAMRLATKLLRLGTWGWDDGACAVAYVCTIDRTPGLYMVPSLAAYLY